MDIKEYRKKHEDEVAHARTRRSAHGAPEEYRGKREADADTRAKMLCNIRMTSRNLDEVIPFFLDILGNKSEAVTVRSAALDMLSATEFVGKSFADYRPQVIDAVRELASDKSPTLRKNALEYLAQQRDDYARDILIAAVTAPEKAPVDQAKAIQLLSLDDHTNAADLVRSRFEDLSETAKEEAAHILGTDPKSADKLSEVMADKSVHERLRRIAAAGLKALNPQRFAERAGDVLVDSGESARLKAALVSMAQLARARQDPVVTSTLDGAVEIARSRTRSKTLKSAADRYLAAQRDGA